MIRPGDHFHPAQVWRWREGQPPHAERDDLATEEPLEIRVGGRSVSVTMRTPGNDDELAIGFLLSEGMIRTRDDLHRVKPCALNDEGNVISAQITPRVSIDFNRLTRHVFASSSCGLCGKASIEQVRAHFPPVNADGLTIAADVIASLPGKLRAAQETFDRTGGLHAAGLFDARGGLVVLREDVGRHNAVDKVLGYAFLAGLLPLETHVLLVSGRSSFEIMQKALSGGVPIVAAVSAPSSLAVRFALDSNQTLVGFLRQGRMNIYSCPQRIRFTDPSP